MLAAPNAFFTSASVKRIRVVAVLLRLETRPASPFVPFVYGTNGGRKRTCQKKKKKENERAQGVGGVFSRWEVAISRIGEDRDQFCFPIADDNDR